MKFSSMSRAATRLLVTLLMATGAVFMAPGSAAAGGYDTPMLYSARHMGMGGTAVAYVDDPSAMFHNPAGLMGTDKLTLMADFSLLMGGITGNPNSSGANAMISDDNPTPSISSDTTVAPFFLIGASGKITEWLSVGFAIYPVASAGATYRYNNDSTVDDPMPDGIDNTTLFFLEISPGIAISIPNTGLSFGLGYRATLVSLDRERVGTGQIDAGFNLSGWSYAGVRVGMQYQLFDRLSFGVTYRHRTTTDVEGTGFLGSAPEPGEEADDGYAGQFTLPSRLSFGFRTDIGPFGFAADAEYALQSQNPDGSITGGPIPVTQKSRWANAWTVRLGAEYRLLEGKLPIRIGYVFDQQTSNATFPTAFGTPPAATHIGTVGAGYNHGPWQANIAYAFRAGSTNISNEDIMGRPSCLSCGGAGEYSIGLNGIYLDFSYHFGRGETRETGDSNRLGHGVAYGPAEEPEVEPEPEPEPEVLDEDVDTEAIPPTELAPSDVEPVDEPSEPEAAPGADPSVTVEAGTGADAEVSAEPSE